MITRTWRYGTKIDVWVCMATKTLLAVDGKPRADLPTESFILIYHGVDPLPAVGSKGTITFTKGGPSGGYWKFELNG